MEVAPLGVSAVDMACAEVARADVARADTAAAPAATSAVAVAEGSRGRLADHWFVAVVAPGLPATVERRIRVVLRELTDVLYGAVVTAPFETSVGYEAGQRLVLAGLADAEVVERTVGLLGPELSRAAVAARAARPADAVFALLGGLARGHADAVRDLLLAQEERRGSRSSGRRRAELARWISDDRFRGAIAAAGSAGSAGSGSASVAATARSGGAAVDPATAVDTAFGDVFGSAAIGYLVVDDSGRILAANDAVTDVIGLDATRMCVGDVWDLAHPTDRRALLAVWEGVLAGRPGQGEWRLARPDGRLVRVGLTASMVPSGRSAPQPPSPRPRPRSAVLPSVEVSSAEMSSADGPGVLASAPAGPGPGPAHGPAADRSYYAVLIEDVTARRIREQRVRVAPSRDGVTGLPDRAFFLDRLAETCRDAPAGTRMGLCLIDLDRFGQVNTGVGHRLADQVLADVGRRMADCLGRPEWSLARIGGDEFVVLVPASTGIDEMTELADRLLAAVRRPVLVDGQEIPVTASIGLVEAPLVGTTPGDLHAAAEVTLRWAKAGGGDRRMVFDAARAARESARCRLSLALPSALRGDEFVVRYQPIVGLSDSLVRGAEALVRWDHPALGLLSPGDFIDAAEQSGLIVPLGLRVLETACRDASRWSAAGAGSPGPFVSVNLSVRQLREPDIVPSILGVLARTGFDPRRLQLELVENLLLEAVGRPLSALRELAGLGVRIAIDDFGTGYSNFAYLSTLPVHGLKLASHFARQLTADQLAPRGGDQRADAHGTDAGDTGACQGGTREAGTREAGGRDAGSGGGGGRAGGVPLDPGRRDRAATPRGATSLMVESIVALVHDLGHAVTAEGIETDEQATRLRDLGVDLGQGHLFGRAMPAEAISAALRDQILPRVPVARDGRDRPRPVSSRDRTSS